MEYEVYPQSWDRGSGAKITLERTGGLYDVGERVEELLPDDTRETRRLAHRNVKWAINVDTLSNEDMHSRLTWDILGQRHRKCFIAARESNCSNTVFVSLFDSIFGRFGIGSALHAHCILNKQACGMAVEQSEATVSGTRPRRLGLANPP